MRRAIIFCLPILLIPMALPQTPPDLTAVLKRVSEIYKAASQYELIGDATCRARPLAAVVSVHLLIAFRAPNKYRMQAGTPCLGSGTGDMGEALMVHDGSALWAYFLETNRYTSIPASALTADAAGDLGDLRPDSTDRSMMWRYRGVADVAAKAAFVREDTVTFAGAKVTCYVVVVPPQERLPAQTWWIDKISYHVIRMDDKDSSTVFTTVKLNEALPDELFKFTPPAGAVKMELDR